MRDKFEIIQTMSVFEFYKGTIYVLRKNKKLRRIVFLPALMLLIFGLLSIPGSSKPGQMSVSVLSQVLFLLGFTICFYVVGFFIILLLMRVLRPALFKNTVYTFNHWGMYKKIGATEYSIPWRDFTGWEETRSFFILYVAVKNAQDGHIISRKAFDEKERHEFIEFLKERFSQYH
jgi:YcxB-like protein